ncbi:hemagglutinin repeat-containing protein [Haemophilus haemolyticus]|uniref:hemagglutinin repeat-containing protein n=1 Tax=Haemophilus haemolyticus TaxID=726 RepID=UPI0009BE107B|nr:hemagglutinin repeat-containing protein [Haemophilus haemolyticus]
MAIAENDLVLNGAKESRDFEEFHKTKSGSLARTTKTSLDQQQSVTQVGTQVSGKEVLLSAGHDVKAKGMQAIADNDLHIQAGHDVDIAADTNHFKNKRVETKKTRGVFTDGGIGFTVGSKSEKHDYETEGWTQSDARSTLGSMNGNITVSAGNHSNVMGTDMITPNTNRIDIKGASVKVEAGKDIIERKEGHEYKQSGVTIALSTPVTDMAQAAYNSVNRSQQVTNGKLKALYAVKAAEEVGMAAQNVGKVAETLDALRAGNMQNTGTTSSPSVKVSIGYGSQKQTQSSESQSISHQKSTVSTGTLNVKARDEKLSFEGVDANAKLMALSGKKGIEIKGVKDEEHQHTKNKSVGGSVGVFVGTNGNSYGVGIEGSVNVAKGKSNSDSERWQNSHLQADKLITNSEAGNLSLDATNLNAKRWEADIQNLTITSRQDTEKYESKQTSASASGSVAQGSGGGASLSASYNKAKVDYAQVNEQAGIRVGEDGMNANIHNHTQLNGAIIESDADASKNHFKTKSLTHTDIENKSEIKTESASMGAGTGGINPMQAISSALSLLGNTNESARSITQSAISGNIQIETETPEKLTALSRDTKNANQRVEKQDLQKVQELQEMAKVIGDISNNAISIATYNEREKINKLSLEKFKAEEKYGKASTQAQEIGKQITAIQNDIDGTYGIGSKTGMAIRAVTAALQAAAQNDTAGSLVALASPYLNKTIHEMTAGDTAKDKATNLMAHALLSAVEFQVTGKDPLTGAVAGVTGEVTAQILTQAIYNKTPNQLTANEKENISTLSQLAGGLASALTAKANGTLTEQGGNFLAATSGAGTAKRAVENNYLWENEQKEFEKKMLECKSKGEDCTSVVNEYLDKSNKRSRELYERCKDGGVGCAGMEEVIDVSTNIARAKYDTSGRLFLGDALQDDDTIKIVNYVNERDLTFLKDRVSATDRMLYQASDITNWPFLLLGARNLLANNSKSAFVSAGIGMGANAGVQYYFNKDIDVVDVVSAGALGKMTAGKSYATTVNSNMVGSYYTGKIKGDSDSDSAYDSIVSGAASKVGYRLGHLVENKLDPIFNPVSNKYKWKDLGYGISFQEGVNPLPSRLGNMADSIASEAINKPLSKDEKK